MGEEFDSAEPAEKIRRDRWGRYMLPHPETGKVEGRTRVTTFAKSISDTYTLSMWQRRMAMVGLARRPDLLARVASLSVDDRDELNQIGEQALDAAAARAAANLGTAIHGFGEQMDAGDDRALERMPANLRPLLEARRDALAAHGIRVVREYIERIVYIPEFDLAGTFDRLVEWTEVAGSAVNKLTVFDDKTGRDLTYGWNEIAIQLWLYGQGTHFWTHDNSEHGGFWTPMPAVRSDKALVCHMPVAKVAQAPSATIFEVDLRPAADAARLCAQVRAWRKTRNLAEPLTVTEAPGTSFDPAVRRAERVLDECYSSAAPDDVINSAILGVEAARRTVTRPPTFAERIEAASSRGELSAVWREATKAGQWTAELEAAGRAKLAQLHTA